MLTVSLFTREWIEIRVPRTHPQSLQVSLFTREWIEIGSLLAWIGTIWVSLFTREWIEICKKEIAFVPNGCLPLYEGVDWNRSTSRTCRGSGASPSLRGSGLKFVTVAFCIIATQKVSLFTREWIEISIPTTQNQQENVSLFTREWIEIANS